MLVLHAAVFAYCEAFASGLQFLVANLLFLARLQALGRARVGGGDGPVARDLLPGLLVGVRSSGKCRGSKKGQ